MRTRNLVLPAHRRVGRRWGRTSRNISPTGTREMIAESAPRFQSKVRENYAVLLADQLKLKCQAIGRPKPYIHWYRNGGLVDDVAVCYTNYFVAEPLSHILPLTTMNDSLTHPLHTAKPCDICDACASTRATNPLARHPPRTTTHVIAPGRALHVRATLVNRIHILLLHGFHIPLLTHYMCTQSYPMVIGGGWRTIMNLKHTGTFADAPASQIVEEQFRSNYPSDRGARPRSMGVQGVEFGRTDMAKFHGRGDR
jgi:hypothetical protein